MINFFRKIRKKLADDNQFLKYSRYAIGEIVLVVVGILIALQINNWNEERKIRSSEREILIEIKENLTQIEKMMRSTLNQMDVNNTYSDTLLNILDKQSNQPEILARCLNSAINLAYGNLQITKNGFETLKNKGLDILSNDEVKKEIVILFEELYPSLLGIFDWKHTDELKHYLDVNFLPIVGDNGLLFQPYDYDYIIKDNYFNTIVHKTKNQRNYFKIIITQRMRDTEKLKDLIQNELNK